VLWKLEAHTENELTGEVRDIPFPVVRLLKLTLFAYSSSFAFFSKLSELIVFHKMGKG